MKIAMASDHAGFDQKPALVAYLAGLGHEVVDMGPASAERCDYPDYADKVARYVAAGGAERGILICGTGIGMAITADKVSGIRAAVIQTPQFAHLFREHNDGNVLCISGRFTSLATNKEIVDEFLATEFGGGRHEGRVAKAMREDDPGFQGVGGGSHPRPVATGTGCEGEYDRQHHAPPRRGGGGFLWYRPCGCSCRVRPAFSP